MLGWYLLLMSFHPTHLTFRGQFVPTNITLMVHMIDFLKYFFLSILLVCQETKRSLFQEEMFFTLTSEGTELSPGNKCYSDPQQKKPLQLLAHISVPVTLGSPAALAFMSPQASTVAPLLCTVFPFPL